MAERESKPAGWRALLPSTDANTVGHDVLASVVVFLVALPLCMGIAIASGVPPAAGLLTGIIGGIVVGILAGSPLQVSGPAAGLAVIVWEIVQKHGFEALGPIVLVAGLLQAVGALCGIGRWFQAVPPSVISGMLAGIGVLIFAGQLHVTVDDVPKGSGLDNLLSIPAAIWKGVVPFDGSPHPRAAAIGLLTIAVVVAWNATAIRARRMRVLPAPLIAVCAATLVANLLGLEVSYVSVPDNLLEGANVASVAGMARLLDPSILAVALAVALVASAETLLCATAIDRLHHGPRTDYDRELLAQGIGNSLCGLVGALPMTGVIVRSSANVEAGARTRLSAVLHGLWLLSLVAAMPFVLRLIPVSSLAAILVFTGYKLARQDVRSLARGGRSEVAIFFATTAGVVVLDLLTGVLIGLGLALIKLIWTLSHFHAQVRHTQDRTVVHLAGTATFVRLPELTAALEAIPDGREVHVHLEDLDYSDHASMEALMAWEKQYQARGGRVYLSWDRLEFLAMAPAERLLAANGGGGRDDSGTMTA